jgi:hypothetical protein
LVLTLAVSFSALALLVAGAPLTRRSGPDDAAGDVVAVRTGGS